MRIALIGAVESTAAVLRSMLALHPPVAVITLPPSRAERHSDYVDLRPLAKAGGVPIVEISDINANDSLNAVRQLDVDYAFVMGWSQICRRPFLALPRRGCLGLHPSLLPSLRGRAVIPWTILLGLPESGLTLFWLADGPDTGDIHSQERIPVSPDETARTLYDKQLAACQRLIRECLSNLKEGVEHRQPQDHSHATYCGRRTPDDGWIDWTQPASYVWSLVRATCDPYPGAYTTYRGSRLIVWKAELVTEERYLGVPGQVHKLEGGTVVVNCGGGGLIRVQEVEWGTNARSSAESILGPQSRLGSQDRRVYNAITGND